MHKGLFVGMLAAVLLGGCASMTVARLPLQIKIIDHQTKQPLQNASVKLVWRVGVGGIIWGKTVFFLSDSNGVVTATAENIPALDELDAPLRELLDKIMVDRIIMKADGYQTLYLRPHGSKVPPVIEMQPVQSEAGEDSAARPGIGAAK